MVMSKKKIKQTDWYSWSVVALFIILGTLIILAIQDDWFGNAFDQYFQIGEYER